MLDTHALCRLRVGPIDLQVEDGACISITGPSGSGKSTLLRMIADLDPHTGDSTLDGNPCSGMPAWAWRRQVTYVAAESGWWGERVDMHFALQTDYAALLPAVGIAAEAATWPVARLSTGERQRLALVRALTPVNRVLLLDEPTSGLDATNTALVEAVLASRLALGTSILIVTHNDTQAARLGSRRMQLHDGRLVERPA